MGYCLTDSVDDDFPSYDASAGSLNALDLVPIGLGGDCIRCKKPFARFYAYRDRRTWMEYYMMDEPFESKLWKFIRDSGNALCFCSQECATKVANANKMEYLMYLTA